jgi:DNA repair exonuclease SbcCD ATPase subunit
MNNDNDIKTDIALIKKDISQIEKMLMRLDTAIEKFEETNQKLFALETTMKLMEQKLINAQEDASLRRREAESSVREIKQQMTSMGISSEESLNNKMDRIFSELKEMRISTSKSFTGVAEEMKKQKKDILETIKSVEARVTKLEQWKWWIMGIAAAVMTLGSMLWKTIFG